MPPRMPKDIVVQSRRSRLRAFHRKQESEKPAVAEPAPIRTEEEQEHQGFKWCSTAGATHISATARGAMSSKVHPLLRFGPSSGYLA